ncbi:MAG: prepilin-type N-terminal cleavage/methylation domain-containing protein [Candidatus Subteraquimicrobiales bacterium]|nr:prepilin-type N-terminal cleavage/methylation domain-containing protein [Candidatus Subteraquimicrobiales bacterium]
MQKGFSLVELIVVLALTVVVLVVAYNIMESGQVTQRRIDEQIQAQMTARRNIAKITKYLRQCAEIKIAGGYQVEVFSDIDDDGENETVRFYLSNENLYQTIDGGAPVKLGDFIRNNSKGEPVFTYIDLEHNALVGGSPLAITHTRSIKIKLIIDVKEGSLPNAFNLETEIRLRNL